MDYVKPKVLVESSLVDYHIDLALKVIGIVVYGRYYVNCCKYEYRMLSLREIHASSFVERWASSNSESESVLHQRASNLGPQLLQNHSFSHSPWCSCSCSHSRLFDRENRHLWHMGSRHPLALSSGVHSNNSRFPRPMVQRPTLGSFFQVRYQNLAV